MFLCMISTLHKEQSKLKMRVHIGLFNLFSCACHGKKKKKMKQVVQTRGEKSSPTMYTQPVDHCKVKRL